MSQQQQSNMVKPQVVGGMKKGMSMKKKKKSGLPTMSKVQGSLKKTMGYA